MVRRSVSQSGQAGDRGQQSGVQLVSPVRQVVNVNGQAARQSVRLYTGHAVT